MENIVLQVDSSVWEYLNLGEAIRSRAPSQPSQDSTASSTRRKLYKKGDSGIESEPTEEHSERGSQPVSANHNPTFLESDGSRRSTAESIKDALTSSNRPVAIQSPHISRHEDSSKSAKESKSNYQRAASFGLHKKEPVLRVIANQDVATAISLSSNVDLHDKSPNKMNVQEVDLIDGEYDEFEMHATNQPSEKCKEGKLQSKTRNNKRDESKSVAKNHKSNEISKELLRSNKTRKLPSGSNQRPVYDEQNKSDTEVAIQPSSLKVEKQLVKKSRKRPPRSKKLRDDEVDESKTAATNQSIDEKQSERSRKLQPRSNKRGVSEKDAQQCSMDVEQLLGKISQKPPPRSNKRRDDEVDESETETLNQPIDEEQSEKPRKVQPRSNKSVVFEQPCSIDVEQLLEKVSRSNNLLDRKEDESKTEMSNQSIHEEQSEKSRNLPPRSSKQPLDGGYDSEEHLVDYEHNDPDTETVNQPISKGNKKQLSKTLQKLPSRSSKRIIDGEKDNQPIKKNNKKQVTKSRKLSLRSNKGPLDGEQGESETDVVNQPNSSDSQKPLTEKSRKPPSRSKKRPLEQDEPETEDFDQLGKEIDEEQSRKSVNVSKKRRLSTEQVGSESNNRENEGRLSKKSNNRAVRPNKKKVLEAIAVNQSTDDGDKDQLAGPKRKNGSKRVKFSVVQKYDPLKDREDGKCFQILLE